MFVETYEVTDDCMIKVKYPDGSEYTRVPHADDLRSMIVELKKDNAALVRAINELKDLVEKIRVEDVEEHDEMQLEIDRLEARLRKIEESKTSVPIGDISCLNYS